MTIGAASSKSASSAPIIDRWAARINRVHPWWPVVSAIAYSFLAILAMFSVRVATSDILYYVVAIALLFSHGVITLNIKDAHLHDDAPPDWRAYPDVVLRYIGHFAASQVFFSVSLFTCFFRVVPGPVLFHQGLLLAYLTVGIAGVIAYPFLARRGLADRFFVLLVPRAASRADWVVLSVAVVVISALALLLAMMGMDNKTGAVFLLTYPIMFAAGLAIREFVTVWVDLRRSNLRLTE